MGYVFPFMQSSSGSAQCQKYSWFQAWARTIWQSGWFETGFGDASLEDLGAWKIEVFAGLPYVPATMPPLGVGETYSQGQNFPGVSL